jgi:hypothetical protein
MDGVEGKGRDVCGLEMEGWMAPRCGGYLNVEDLDAMTAKRQELTADEVIMLVLLVLLVFFFGFIVVFVVCDQKRVRDYTTGKRNRG